MKQEAIMDSLDAKERSYDYSTNGINFMIRKVNLMFVFIVVVWKFFLINTWSKILCFFVYNVITLSIVYAIVLWANFYVKLLMSSTKAAVNSFDECNVFEKAAQLSVIVYDNKLNNSNAFCLWPQAAFSRPRSQSFTIRISWWQIIASEVNHRQY